MEEKVIYIPYKLSGFERDMWCDYCDCQLNEEFDEVYCKFYQNEQTWFEKIICPNCYHLDTETERPKTEVISFLEADDVFKKLILQSVFCDCHF